MCIRDRHEEVRPIGVTVFVGRVLRVEPRTARPTPSRRFDSLLDCGAERFAVSWLKICHTRDMELWTTQLGASTFNPWGLNLQVNKYVMTFISGARIARRHDFEKWLFRCRPNVFSNILPSRSYLLTIQTQLLFFGLFKFFVSAPVTNRLTVTMNVTIISQSLMIVQSGPEVYIPWSNHTQSVRLVLNCAFFESSWTAGVCKLTLCVFNYYRLTIFDEQITNASQTGSKHNNKV